jgi:hypothetical protein
LLGSRCRHRVAILGVASEVSRIANRTLTVDEADEFAGAAAVSLAGILVGGTVARSQTTSWARAARPPVADGSHYSVAFEMELDPSSYPGASRAAHFQEANQPFLSAMDGDEQFARTMQEFGVSFERTATGLAPRASPVGWTRHHAESPGVMQLVPRAQHTPGAIFWDELHPCGQGGYAIC